MFREKQVLNCLCHTSLSAIDVSFHWLLGEYNTWLQGRFSYFDVRPMRGFFSSTEETRWNLWYFEAILISVICLRISSHGTVWRDFHLIFMLIPTNIWILKNKVYVEHYFLPIQTSLFLNLCTILRGFVKHGTLMLIKNVSHRKNFIFLNEIMFHSFILNFFHRYTQQDKTFYI